MKPMNSKLQQEDPCQNPCHGQVRALLDRYIALYAAPDSVADTSLFSDSFSGCARDAQALVHDCQEWIDSTRPHFSALFQGLCAQSAALLLQDLSDGMVLVTAVLHLPLAPTDPEWANTAMRLLLIARRDNGVWKIAHNGFSNACHCTPKSQANLLQGLLQERVQDLRRRETLYRQLTEDARDVLWQTDSALRMTYISPADERLRGFKASEVLGRPVFEMFTDEGVAVLKQKMLSRSTLEDTGEKTGFSMFEVQHRCKDGSLIWGEVFAKPDRDATGAIVGYHGITRETTERKHLQDQVYNLAFHDPLTQLANRRLLVDRLGHSLLTHQRQHGHGALLFLDLDNFKLLNDTHGHGAGDLLLVEVGHRLKACVRNTDTVARFGGDEFVVLLDSLGSLHGDALAQAASVAEKIRIALARPYQLGWTLPEGQSTTVEHRCTASIGAVLFDGHDGSAGEVVEKADAAMYRAKEEGRDRVCFHTALSGVQDARPPQGAHPRLQQAPVPPHPAAPV